MLDESRVIRIERPSRQIVGILPRCGRCDKILERSQFLWCSPACAQEATRRRKALQDYWVEKGLA